MLRRLLNRLSGRTPQKMQEQMDLFRIYQLALSHRELQAARREVGDAEVDDAVLERLVERVDRQLNKTKQQNYATEAQKLLVEQTRALFEALLPLEDQPSALQPSPALDEAQALLKARFGFAPRVGPSAHAGAGTGVWVDGKADVGSVVALYPGQVYLFEHLADKALVEALFADGNDYVASRATDRVVIDGRSADQCPPSPLAAAHLANHPPKGTQPNVVSFPIDFSLSGDEFPPELQRLVPNAYVKKPSTLGRLDLTVFMQSMAMVALRPLEDEELFLNYRLNPALQRPAWYTPVDEEEDKRRWGS